MSNSFGHKQGGSASTANEYTLSRQWCISARGGMYVVKWSGLWDDKEEYAKGHLERIGTVRGVKFSSVYVIRGRIQRVFKIQVSTDSYLDPGHVFPHPSLKWFVVEEDDFDDFSCPFFRHNHLQPTDLGCLEVDPMLLCEFNDGFGENGGRWLKNWLTDIQTLPDEHPWAIPDHGIAPATPPVSDPDEANSTDEPADVQEQKQYAAVLVPVPYGLRPESDVAEEGTW